MMLRNVIIYGSLYFIEGLFMGVSILSLVEIFYYLTLRLACNLNHQRHRKVCARDSNLYEADNMPDLKIVRLQDEMEKCD